MNIINTNLKFEVLTKVPLSKKSYITIHHDAWENATPELIHSSHLRRGYGGAGYNYWIDKEGLIYALRPLDTIGAHCPARNYEGIGICLNGNFMKHLPSKASIDSLEKLISHLTIRLNIPIANIELHRELSNTLCPGDMFPHKELILNLKAHTHWAYDAYRYALDNKILLSPKDLDSYPTYGELLTIIKRLHDVR